MNNQELTLVAAKVGGVALPENSQWHNRVEIRSETSSRLYIIAQRKSDGSFGCSCPGWRSHRHCKHLDTMVPLLSQAVKPEQARRIG